MNDPTMLLTPEMLSMLANNGFSGMAVLLLMVAIGKLNKIGAVVQEHESRLRALEKKNNIDEPTPRVNLPLL